MKLENELCSFFVDGSANCNEQTANLIANIISAKVIYNGNSLHGRMHVISVNANMDKQVYAKVKGIASHVTLSKTI